MYNIKSLHITVISVRRECIMLIHLYAEKTEKLFKNSVRLGLVNKNIILPLLRAGTSYKVINHECLFSFFFFKNTVI